MTMNEINQRIKELYDSGTSYDMIARTIDTEFQYAISVKAIHMRLSWMEKKGLLVRQNRRIGKKKYEGTEIPGVGVIGLSETELRQKHDVKYQIRQAVKELPSGRFLTRQEFINFAKIKTGVGYIAHLEHPDFSKYRGKAAGVEYWGRPESVEQMKQEGILKD